MRVAFAGTPPFAATALEAIAAAGHDIPLVLTQPDRPAGRGMRVVPSAVSATAARLGLAVSKPATLKEDGARLLREASPDCLVVAAYGLLLPKSVLDVPPGGCLNIHASLLPRWRGAAPIQRALLAGDEVTGICIMRMDEGLDTGDVVLEKELPIGPRDTTGSLTAALARLGAEAIVEALPRLADLPRRRQDASRATYAPKVAKAEARIDWRRPSAEIDRLVRAFDPAPGAETRLAGEALKVWQADPVAGHGEPGQVLEATPAGIVVACGQGALRLLQVQRPGGRRLAVRDFLAGKVLSAGSLLGADA